MKKSRIPVSDHALVRYLERVEGFDIERLRRFIGHKVDRAREHPAATGVVADGVVYKIIDGVVTTVTPRNWTKHVRRRNARRKARK